MYLRGNGSTTMTMQRLPQQVVPFVDSGTIVVNVSDIPIYEPSQLPPILPVSVAAPSIAPPMMESSFPWWIVILLGLAFLVKTKKG